MAKVYIRRSDMNKDPTPVAAWYDEGTEVDARAHADCVVMHLPASAIVTSNILGMPVLDKAWRTSFSQDAAASLASARVEDVMPVEDQLASIIETLDYITTYGADTTKWPQQVQTRRREIGEAWKYMRDVRTRAASYMARGQLPFDIISDSNWPARIQRYRPPQS